MNLAHGSSPKQRTIRRGDIHRHRQRQAIRLIFLVMCLIMSLWTTTAFSATTGSAMTRILLRRHRATLNNLSCSPTWPLRQVMRMRSAVDTFPSSEKTQLEKYESLFTLELPEGRCVGLRLAAESDETSHPDALTRFAVESNDKHWINGCLHPEEVSFGLGLKSTYALQTFYLGRLAMRQALREEKAPIDDCIILRDDSGRPTLPKGFLGSISHKGTTGVALVARVDYSDPDAPAMGVGIDIEYTHSKRRSVAKRILTPQEIEDLGRIEGISKEEEVLLRFSIKESLYKAMHPLICQFVGFQEGDVTPHADGTAEINLYIKNGAHEKFDTITAHWRKVTLHGEPFFLTSVGITMRPDSSDDGSSCTMD